MNEKMIQAAADHAGVDYAEALAKIEGARQVAQQNMAKQGKTDPKLPAWHDVLGEAEQLVRQKPTWSRFIKGTPLENDVPVWIADFAQRTLQRERARTNAEIGAVEARPFGWLFEGPEGLRQFSKAEDFTKPVLDLHRRMAEQQPEKYTLTPLYAHGVEGRKP